MVRSRIHATGFSRRKHEGQGEKEKEGESERGWELKEDIVKGDEEQVREKGGNGTGIDYSDYVASNSTVRTA